MDRVTRAVGPVAAVAALMFGAHALAAAQGLPPMQQSGNVSYVSGGVGLDESKAFLRHKSEFPLAVEIYAREGGREVYTAGAEVAISDSQGREILQTQADGPFLFAEVPAGRYAIEVTRDGQTRRAHASVQPGRSARSVFVFDSSATSRDS